MINFLATSPSVGTYTTQSGEHALVRYGLSVDVPELAGFRAQTAHRTIVEAVFVDAEHIDRAMLALMYHDPARALAERLDAFWIPFRLPRVHPAPTLRLVDTSVSPADDDEYDDVDGDADGPGLAA